MPAGSKTSLLRSIFGVKRPKEEQIAGKTPQEIPPVHLPVRAVATRGDICSPVGRTPSGASELTPIPPPSQTTGPAFFANSSNFKLDTLQYIDHSKSTSGTNHWGDVLLRNTAPNALFNSADRFDPPKCDEDTRTEVIGEIMSWIQDRELPCRLLCMTGAAGAGKSALQQTISERCSKANILAASFFFQSNDHTRNDVMRIIPTIAYQLGLKSTPLRDLITRSVEEDPMVFLRSLDGQIQQLILEPLERLRSRPDSKFNSLPHAIIIDGLDECYGEDMQELLLLAIQRGLLDNDLPFRIVISSRPEWAIRNALARTGHLHGKVYHIRLSDDFDVTADIRRTLWRRLREIGGRSNDPRAKDPSWPSEQDVEAIVEASSGQYIYAATVIRYVSEKRSSPVERLRTILTWSPHAEQRAKPFATLDRLYTNIVSSAKVAYENVDTNKPIFLLLLRAYRMHKLSQEWILLFLRCPLSEASHSRLVELDSGGAETLLSDLQSLVTLETTRTDDGYRYKMLRYYHKSFGDFLDSESRAGELYVSSEAAQEHLAVTHMRYIKSLEVPALGIDRLPKSVLDECSWCFLTLPGFLKELPRGSPMYRDLLEMSEARSWEKIEAWFASGSTRHLHDFYVKEWLSALTHLLTTFEGMDTTLIQDLTALRAKL